MVHNDLKPDNILLERLPTSSMDVPRVMVGDFGQAAVFGMPQPGDPRYCSPEAHRMALGQGGVPGFKGDVYMLGVTLYELLSGGNLPYIEQPCTLSQYSVVGWSGAACEEIQIAQGVLEPHGNPTAGRG